MLNGNHLCHSLQTLSLTFRQMLAQLTNTRAFKFRYRGTRSGTPSAIPFVQLSGCLQNASQKHTATILPRNHVTDIQIFSAFYTLSHLLKSHSTHMQLTTHLSKFNSTAVSQVTSTLAQRSSTRQNEPKHPLAFPPLFNPSETCKDTKKK